MITTGKEVKMYNTINGRWYKGYYIEHNFYGKGEYTVDFEGSDLWFTTQREAKEFIDSIQEEN